MEMATPPMTAMASGCSICEPAPRASARGRMPVTVASAVIRIGTQATLRCHHHGFASPLPFSPKALVGVKQKDAVLRDDADDHDEAHEGRDVEAGSGEQQREDDTADREHGGDQDGEGCGEVAELGKQDAEDQRERERENQKQIRKGLPLLLVGAAVFHANARGKVHGGDPGLHLPDRRAEVRSFEAAGDDD